MRWTRVRQAGPRFAIIPVCCLGACPALAQNLLIVEPQSQSIAGVIGQGNLVAAFPTQGVTSTFAPANVNFKLSSIGENSNNILVVSPSSGTTPATIWDARH